MRAKPPETEILPAAPQRLRRRADFVAASTGKRVHMRNFSLQGLSRGEPDGVRIGLTVTKKVGGAVERNRIRRRLKEALRLCPNLAVQGGHDYVVVARREALAAPFAGLQLELQRAVTKLHSAKPDRPRPPGNQLRETPAKRDRAPTK